MDRSRRSRLARRWLVAFGAAAAAFLVALSLLGFGDARDAARLQIEREAAASAQALQGEWERRREPRRPPVEGASPRSIDASSAARVAPPDRSKGWEDGSYERLFLVAARAEAAAGDLESAVGHVRDALEASPALGGEALLTLVHAHRQCGRTEDLAPAYRSAAKATSFDSVVGSTSGRLLALLSAASALPTELIEQELDALARAAAAGALALPGPLDGGIVDPSGFVFVPDPTWAALAELAQEAVPSPRWAEILQVPAREQAAFASTAEALFEAPLEERWSASRLKRGRWLLARRDGDALTTLTLDGDAIDRDLVRALPGGSGFDVRAFGDGREGEVLAGPVELAGAAAPLSIVHPSPAALLGPAIRRIAALRIGLAVVAVLLLFSSLAGARALARAERLEALRSTFVASVSHDLRTPIASIGLLAENMASGWAKGSEERYVESIQTETARLRRLVDDLLDFGRIERGLPPRLQIGEVQLGAWLDAFEARERARCHAAECALFVERGALPGTARLDAGALERALSNLVDNALKHAAARSITLRVRGTEGDSGSEGDSTMLTFEVEDDGAGLSKAALSADLFEPFERRGESAGTGLGLTIVRSIARAHGGSASLEPRIDGPGARATLTIAARKVAA